MTHLLDTNACVEYLRQGPSSKVARRVKAAPAGSVSLCSIVVGELLYGGWRSATLAKVREFCAGFNSLPFDDRAAESYAEIRAQLDRLGTPIGPNDLLIAAIALANG